MSHYSVRIHWSPEDEMYVAVCPELGDLSALGETAQQAAAELEQAISLALETYAAEGWSTPEPEKLEAFSGQFRLRLPRALHAWLADQAKRQGVSLNTLVTSLLAQAQGTTQAQATLSQEVRQVLNEFKLSLTCVHDAVSEMAVDSSTFWSYESQPDSPKYDSRAGNLKLGSAG